VEGPLLDRDARFSMNATIAKPFANAPQTPSITTALIRVPSGKVFGLPPNIG
jgi:hypothetical protein